MPAVTGFVVKLEQDRSAVEAALTLPYSQGQTEGQINRLKMLKRTMYGRAKFDVLRKRFLAVS
jgi:transposase